MTAQETNVRLYCEAKTVKSSLRDTRGVEVGSLVVKGVASDRLHTLVPAPDFDFAKSYNMRNVGFPDVQANRLIGFYGRYLSIHNAYKMRGWNGHSFVAAVMGMAVDWDGNRRPKDLRIGDQVEANEVEACQPYASVSADGALTQSFFGVGNGEVLGVVGRGASLQIMPITSWQDVFPGTLHGYAGVAEGVAAIDSKADWRHYDLPAPTAN